MRLEPVNVRTEEKENACENIHSRSEDIDWQRGIIIILWLFVQLYLSLSSSSSSFSSRDVQMSSIVHLYLNRRTRRNGGRIHDVNDVFSQIRLPSPILPSFISSDRMSSLHRLLITTSFAVGVVQQMFWTHTSNEGQADAEEKFSSRQVFCLCIRRSVGRSLVIDLYTFHTCLLMMHLTYPDRFIPSFGQFNTRQMSENDHQWYRIGCFEILYNHRAFGLSFLRIVSVRHFLSLCI